MRSPLRLELAGPRLLARGPGAALVPRDPPLLDRDTSPEIAGAFGTDAMGTRSFTPGVDNRIRPQPNVF